MADARYAVGRFLDPVARELLDPDERVVVDLVRAADRPTSGADRLAHEMVRRTGLTMVPRTIAINEAIRAATDDDVARQVVILGAGLDARGYRMAELAAATVFEVDHPASQQDKLSARWPVWCPLAGRPSSTWLSISVAQPLPSGRLEESRVRPPTSRHDLGVGGVVPYLTGAQVRGRRSRRSRS